MIKTACFLTGDNFTILENETPASKKKVIALAIALTVPVLIWFLNGFLLSYMVLHTGVGSAILVASICAILIFATEKMILMANGNSLISFFRFFTGLVTALIGSIAIDEVVFKNDIDTEVEVIKQIRIEEAKTRAENAFISEHKLLQLDSAIQNAQTNFNLAEKSAIDEADGTNGTGHKGMGVVASFKNQKALQRKSDLAILIAKKDSLDKEKNTIIEKAGNITMSSFNSEGLLVRVEALFQLISRNLYMTIIYIAFTLLFLFLELLVVILKISWKKTNYENRLELIEYLGKKRLNHLQMKHLAVTDPGYYDNCFANLKHMLNTSNGMYNNDDYNRN